MPERFRYSRARGWLSHKSRGANASENVAMELANQERFQRPPKASRTQMSKVIRDQHNIGGIVAGMDLVRAAKSLDAVLDTQTLLDDVELQQVRRLDGSDALCQITCRVDTAHRRPSAILVTFGSNRVRKQCAKKEGRTAGNFFIEQDVVPDRFRTGVEVKPRRY